MRHRRIINWGLIISAWTLVGLFFATQHYLFQVRRGAPSASWSQSLLNTLPDWYLWALFFPCVFWLARRYRIDRHQFLPALAVHVPIGMLMALVHLVLATSVLLALESLRGKPYHFHTLITYIEWNFLLWFHWNALTYMALVALCHALEYYHRFEERQRVAVTLEALVTQAQLQALKSQLRPHFLFNSLNAVAELVHEDPDAAEEMILSLSDLLRRSLDVASQEVPLSEELDFVRAYLEIEQLRFQDRLRVDWRIEPRAQEMLVPNLILQPLVENAVRYGTHRGVGHIELSAVLRGDLLELEVRDHGPGFSDNGRKVRGNGLGLINAHQRLDRLYGPPSGLQVGNAPGGGAYVTVMLPARPAPLTEAPLLEDLLDDDPRLDRRRRALVAPSNPQIASE